MSANQEKKKLIVDSDLKSPSNEEVKDLSLRTRKHRNKKRRKYYQNKNNFKKWSLYYVTLFFCY